MAVVIKRHILYTFLPQLSQCVCGEFIWLKWHLHANMSQCMYVSVKILIIWGSIVNIIMYNTWSINYSSIREGPTPPPPAPAPTDWIGLDKKTFICAWWKYDLKILRSRALYPSKRVKHILKIWINLFSLFINCHNYVYERDSFRLLPSLNKSGIFLGGRGAGLELKSKEAVKIKVAS